MAKLLLILNIIALFLNLGSLYMLFATHGRLDFNETIFFWISISTAFVVNICTWIYDKE